MDNLEKLMVEKRIGDEAGNSFNDNWTQCWDYVLTGCYQACNPYRQAIV